ncbi:E3 ubiquitin-protein ligase SDIR1 isoform C [Glycine soja]|uniref:E3 ubiquitin-protein ligase SDIR1 isoform C n=1 Tax=Glycine soja TaxID=3848 RepID=A0A445ILN0_GLYSO|nr:E3 ubiquitin-protein ligase SDIR1 isoform C [Glycine soja]
MTEDMKIDHIVEVPDTPDRTTVRHDYQKYLGNPDKRGRAFNAADENNNHSNYISLSPSEESYSSQNAPIFRRAQTDGAEKMEKGKSISSKVPSKSSHRGISILDLTEENEQIRHPKPAFSHRGSRDNATEDKKALKATNGRSSLPVISDSSNTSRNAFIGKYKLDIKTLPGPNISVDHGKGISLSNDSQLQNEKQVSLPPRVSTSPRGRGHKRLVRNGCISPHNIATMEKQLAEQSNHKTKDVEQSHGHSVSSSTVSPVSVDDIVAGERGNGRGKGKEVLAYRSPHRLTFRTASSPVTNYEEINGPSNAIRNPLQYSGGQGGRRTTHNERNANWHLHDVNGHHLRINNDVGRFINGHNTTGMDRRNTGNGQSSNHIHGSQSDHTAQPTSVIIPDVDQSSGTHRTADILTKRQRKRESPSGFMFRGSTGDSSSSSRNPVSDPEVIELLSPPRGSSSSSRTSVLDHEVVDLLSTPRYANRSSEDLDDNDNNSSEARARQVEADERLARELQEQLYHDDPFEGRGIDEDLAWDLQRAEALMRATIDSHSISQPRQLPRAIRQPRTRFPENPSRRRAMAQASFSNRMSQWRSRATSRTRAPSTSSRGRGPRFPLDMDLDMRLDILEALEDSVGDFSDMGITDGIFNARRDFTDADYEMLLALDEGNHQHTGASSNLINSLPQSTIQVKFTGV